MPRNASDDVECARDPNIASASLAPARRYRSRDRSLTRSREQESQSLPTDFYDLDNPARSPEYIDRLASSIEDMDARWVRKRNRVVGAGPEELAIANDDAICGEHRALKKLHRCATVARQRPSDALGYRPGATGRCRFKQDHRALAPHPVVRRGMLTDLRRIVRQIRKQVDHNVRREAMDRPAHRFALEDVAHNRLGANASQRIGLFGSTGHPSDVVTPFDEQRHEAQTDHATRTCHEDPHSSILCSADMVLEHAILAVIPGEETAFEEAFSKATSIISASVGFRCLRLSRCIEEPSRYLLLVEWENLKDHTEGFRGSPAYEEWRLLLHHFYDPFPTVEHFKEVTSVLS